MKFSKKRTGLISLLVLVIIGIALLGTSCVSGMATVGWSGGTVNNGILYIGSNEGRLTAINLEDTSIRWAEAIKAKAQTGLFGCSMMSGCSGGSGVVPIYGTPVVSDNIVYIAGYNGRLYAYNTTDLALKWVYPRDGYLKAFVGGVVVTQGKLIIGCSDGFIYSLDALTGNKIAEYKTGNKIWGTPAVDGDTLYIGSFDKTLYALNIADLKPKWQREVDGSIISTPVVDNGTVYFGSFDKNLYAVDAATGNVKWKFAGEKFFWAQPLVIDGAVYAGCLDDKVYVVNASTGTKITEYDLESPVSSAPVQVGNYAVFASVKGVLYKIDTATREITKVKTFTKTTINGPLTAYDGIIYIHPQESRLIRYNLETGAELPDISLLS